MPAKRTVGLEVVSVIVLVAALVCSIQMTWEFFDSMLSSMSLELFLEFIQSPIVLGVIFVLRITKTVAPERL